MAEYIEREALIAKMKKLFSPELLQNATEQEISRAAIMLVEYEPAADVEEVKHGKWVRMEDDFVYWYACSECKGHIPKTEYGNDAWSDYCPRCGAIMDLGDDEE